MSVLCPISYEIMNPAFIILTSGHSYHAPTLYETMGAPGLYELMQQMLEMPDLLTIAAHPLVGLFQELRSKTFSCPTSKITFKMADIACDQKLTDIIPIIEEMAAEQNRKITDKSAKIDVDQVDYAKASDELLDKLLVHLTDFFTQKIIVSPVLLTDGRTVEEASLQNWLAKINHDASEDEMTKPIILKQNPTAAQANQKISYVKNYAFGNIVDDFLKSFSEKKIFQALKEGKDLEKFKKVYRLSDQRFETVLEKYAYENYFTLEHKSQFVFDNTLKKVLPILEQIALQQGVNHLKEIDYTQISHSNVIQLATLFQEKTTGTIMAKPVLLENGTTTEEDRAKEQGKHYVPNGALLCIISDFLKGRTEYEKDVYLSQADQKAITKALEEKNKQALEKFHQQFRNNGMFKTLLADHLSNPIKAIDDYILFFEEEKANLIKAMRCNDLSSVLEQIKGHLYGPLILLLPANEAGETPLDIAVNCHAAKASSLLKALLNEVAKVSTNTSPFNKTSSFYASPLLEQFLYKNYLTIEYEFPINEIFNKRLAQVLAIMGKIAKAQGANSLQAIDYTQADVKHKKALLKAISGEADTILANPILLRDGSTIEQNKTEKEFFTNEVLRLVIKDFLNAYPKAKRLVYPSEAEQKAINSAIDAAADYNNMKLLAALYKRYCKNGLFLKYLKDHVKDIPPKKMEEYVFFFNEEKQRLISAMQNEDLTTVLHIVERHVYGINLIFLPLDESKNLLEIAYKQFEARDSVIVYELLKKAKESKQSIHSIFNEHFQAIESKIEGYIRLKPGMKGVAHFGKVLMPNANMHLVWKDGAKPSLEGFIVKDKVYRTSVPTGVLAGVVSIFSAPLPKLPCLDEEATKSLKLGKERVDSLGEHKKIHITTKTRKGVMIVYLDGSARLIEFNGNNGKEVYIDKFFPEKKLRPLITAAVIDPDTNRVIYGLKTGEILIWNFDNDTYEVKGPVTSYPIQAMILNDSGKLIITSGKTCTKAVSAEQSKVNVPLTVKSQLDVLAIDDFVKEITIKDIGDIATAVCEFEHDGSNYYIIGDANGGIKVWGTKDKADDETQYEMIAAVPCKGKKAGYVRALEQFNNKLISIDSKRELAQLWKFEPSRGLILIGQKKLTIRDDNDTRISDITSYSISEETKNGVKQRKINYQELKSYSETEKKLKLPLNELLRKTRPYYQDITPEIEKCDEVSGNTQNKCIMQ